MNLDLRPMNPLALLNRIKEVDGADSGLDADTVDGKDSSVFSEKSVDETIGGSKTWSNATLNMTNLPTSDPAVAGQLWNNSGALTVSAG